MDLGKKHTLRFRPETLESLNIGEPTQLTIGHKRVSSLWIFVKIFHRKCCCL